MLEDEEDTGVQIIWDEESQSYLAEDWERNQQNFYRFVRDGYIPPIRPQEIQPPIGGEFSGEIPAGADISDWFNYGTSYPGLNEKTLQDYINSQRQKREEALRKYHENTSGSRNKNPSPDRKHKKSRKDKKRRHEKHRRSSKRD